MKNIILLLMCVLPAIMHGQQYVKDTAILNRVFFGSQSSGLIGGSNIDAQYLTIPYECGIASNEFSKTLKRDILKPDTAEAHLLVTMPRGIAQQRRGYVVISIFDENIYLDCNKQIIKPPYIVWQYRAIHKK